MKACSCLCVFVSVVMHHSLCTLRPAEADAWGPVTLKAGESRGDVPTWFAFWPVCAWTEFHMCYKPNAALAAGGVPSGGPTLVICNSGLGVENLIPPTSLWGAARTVAGILYTQHNGCTYLKPSGAAHTCSERTDTCLYKLELPSLSNLPFGGVLGAVAGSAASVVSDTLCIKHKMCTHGKFYSIMNLSNEKTCNWRTCRNCRDKYECPIQVFTK